MYSLSSTQGMSQSSGRVDWVDYAKGFCIIFVVMMHSTLGVEGHAVDSGIAAPGTTGWMNYLVTFARPFRMPDFFMISGLFLGLVIGRPWLRYIDRKVIHFIYFYLLWLVIQFGLRSSIQISKGAGFDDIIGSFFFAFVEPYNTLWFIYLLPIFFVLTRLLRPVHWVLVLIAASVLETLPIFTGSTVVDEFAARYVFFFAGFALAKPIFNLAAWARVNPKPALSYLGIWFIVNAVCTFTPVPDAISAALAPYGYVGLQNISYLPLVSLLLGAAGAVAVVCLCAVLSRFKLAGFLRYLGANSIVVYLAFFLPMIATRMVLLKYAPALDLGTISLLVTIAGVIGPVGLYEFTRITGWGTFLFKRPGWAWIDRTGQNPSGKAALNPAE